MHKEGMGIKYAETAELNAPKQRYWIWVQFNQFIISIIGQHAKPVDDEKLTMHTEPIKYEDGSIVLFGCFPHRFYGRMNVDLGGAILEE